MPTQAEFAGHVGIVQSAVSDLVKRGILPEGGTLDAWRLAYCAHIRAVAARWDDKDAAGAPSELTAERTRLTKAQADEVELKVEILRGNLVPADQVERELGDLVTAARAKMLGIPTKSAPRVMAADSVQEAAEILKQDIWEALAELAIAPSGNSLARGEAAYPIALGAAAGPDDQRLGGPELEAKPRRQRGAGPVQ